MDNCKRVSLCLVVTMDTARILNFVFSDVLKVLQDLDETTLHTVDILSHFVVRGVAYCGTSPSP